VPVCHLGLGAFRSTGHPHESGGAGIHSAKLRECVVSGLDSCSPAFAEDKLRGNDCDSRRPFLANDTSTPIVEAGKPITQPYRFGEIPW
jgi:hypothetical protein